MSDQVEPPEIELPPTWGAPEGQQAPIAAAPPAPAPAPQPYSYAAVQNPEYAQRQDPSPPPYAPPPAAPDAPAGKGFVNGSLVAPKWVGAVVGALVVVGFIIYELVPANVAPPATYSQYISPDNRFRVDGPSGWSLVSAPSDESRDLSAGGVLFANGAAKIDVTTDSTAKLTAHDLLTSDSPTPESLGGDPTPSLHKYYTNQLGMLMKNYQENATTTISTNMGDATVTEFTGVGGMFGLGGPMHGYQASLVLDKTTYEIVAQCPEKSWIGLQPAFQHVIASLEPADGKPLLPLDAGTDANGGDAGGGPDAAPANSPPVISAPDTGDFGHDSQGDPNGGGL